MLLHKPAARHPGPEMGSPREPGVSIPHCRRRGPALPCTPLLLRHRWCGWQWQSSWAASLAGTQSQDHNEWEGKITNETKDSKKIFHQHWLSPLVHIFFTNTSALVTSVINLFREVKKKLKNEGI